MKKTMALVLSVLMVMSQMVYVAFAETVPTEMPLMISGTIQEETADSILVKPYNSDNSIMLKITNNTYVYDVSKHGPALIKDRVGGDSIIAYYGPATTKSIPAQSNAVAIISSLPMDYHPPYYAKVESLVKGTNEIMVTINAGSMIVNIKNDTPITPFTTGSGSKISDIAVGTELLIWSGVATMSFPGKTAADQVIILSSTEMSQMPQVTSPMAFKVEKKAIALNDGKITGELPQLTGITDKKYANDVNAMFDAVSNNAVAELAKNKDSKIMLSYEMITSGFYTSFIIHTNTSNGNTASDTIKTVVLNNTKNMVYTLQDVLGVNAYKLATQSVKNQIAKDTTGKYTPEATVEVNMQTNFYIDDNGNINIIFDKYAIAPGSTGTPIFMLSTNNIMNFELATSQTFMQGSVTMIPLRPVAEAFGYMIKWDAATSSIVLTNGNDTCTLMVNSNMYNKDITLDSAPIIKDEMTYVPASFVEKVLGGQCSVSGTQMVFSKLK